MDGLHKKIKELRESLKMSQEELAKKTGYTSRSSIAKIESGKVDLPQSKIKLFANALKTTTAYLMGVPAYLVYDKEEVLNICKKLNMSPFEYTGWDYDLTYTYQSLSLRLGKLGYTIGAIPSEGYLWIEYGEGSFEIDIEDLNELDKSLDSYLKFKVQELKDRKIIKSKKK